ncbi:PAS domain S-box-containing protein [Skermanella aerolata]|uniref:PAS domain-containing sensor histidine kinase n=1 Tax=Skermanella aerolata TaxID=393310 RepID=UPI003D1A02CA
MPYDIEALRTVIGLLKDPALLLDTDGRTLAANRRSAALLRSCPEASRRTNADGERFFDGLPAAGDRVPWQTAARSVVKSGKPVHREGLIHGRRFDVMLAPLTGPDGQPCAVLCHAVEQSQPEPGRSRGSDGPDLQSILDQIPYGIFWKDLHSRYVGCNKPFADATGLADPREIAGLSDFQLFDPDMARTLHREDQEVVRSGRVLRKVEQQVTWSSGRSLDVEKLKLPLRSGTGDIIGVLGMVEDVTARRETEERLRAAKQEAERISAAKSSLFAAASHDLRQPIQAMSLFVALLANRVADPAALALVEKLRQSMTEYTTMLDALLDLSKLETGTLDPVIMPIRLQDLLRRLDDEFAPLAAEKGLRLTVVPTSLSVRSDPMLLDRMLRNLIANAIRYTAKGRILIGCRRRGKCACIDVQDTGIGIPADKLGHIFREFYQIGHDASGAREGAGLGLAIVHRISVSLHHEVSVSSRVGHGSRFSVEVPIEFSPEAAASQEG